MSKITIIAAVGENRELGKNNNLIWKLKGDMEFFKENTMNHKVVMGYNTFLSIPKRLPNREEIVLTHKNLDTKEVRVFNDFEELITYLNSIDEEVFIIGGASIYKLFLPYASDLLLTEVKKSDKDADVYFPEWDKNNFHREVIRSVDDEEIKYEFVRYRKKEIK